MPAVRPVIDPYLDPRPWAEQEAELIAAVHKKYNGVAKPAPPEGFETRQISTIPDLGPTKWRIQELWTDQAVGIVGGEPKAYKSFLTEHLAVCVAAGIPALGKFTTVKGRVLMFNAEDRPTMTRGRIQKMCVALQLDFAALDLQLINVPALRLDDTDTVARLSITVGREHPDLLILDPLRDLHGLDENDAQSMSALLYPLRLLQREHGCAVMLVHHMAKVGEVTRRPGQRLRGSSALHGWVDSALYLSAKDDAVTVIAEHREAESPKPFAFAVEKGSDDHGQPLLWLELRELAADAAKEDAEDEDARIIEILESEVGGCDPLTMRTIRQLRGNSAKADAAVKRLAAAGRIAYVEFQQVVGGKSRPAKGWTKC